MQAERERRAKGAQCERLTHDELKINGLFERTRKLSSDPYLNMNAH